MATGRAPELGGRAIGVVGADMRARGSHFERDRALGRTRVRAVLVSTQSCHVPSQRRMAALALAGTIGALMLVPCCLRPLRGPAARFYAAPTTRRIAARMAANLSNQSSSRRQGAYIQSIDEAAGALRAGRLVAFPTETVYGLGAHAFDNDAVASIFTVKGLSLIHI